MLSNMNDQSREIIPGKVCTINEKNDEVINCVVDGECSAILEKKQNDYTSASAANTVTICEGERLCENSEVNDFNNKIVKSGIEDNSICNNSNTEIVNIMEEDDVILQSKDNESESKYNLDIEIKFENFDTYEDENNKIYKKYNLRKAVKKLTASLNEDRLFQNLQDQPAKISTKSSKKNSEQLNIIVPKPNRYYSCDMCPETFETKHFLISHKERHGNKYLYKCFYCLKDFGKNEELLEHKKVHRNERCFTCGKCEKAFSSGISYLKHTYNHLKPPYKCQECLFTAKEIGTIKAHVSLHSDLEKKCNVCKKIVHERKLCNHDSFECGECGKVLTSKSSFEYHMITHTGVKRFQCLYCGKAFANSCQVKVHTTIHTDVHAYECNICDMKFRQYTDLKRHNVIHFEKRFGCDYCGKKFLHKESIRFHIRLHTNYKPYKCPECSMSFVTSTHLTSHTYKVHVRNRFSCDTCSTKFASKTGLTRHMTSISHRNKLYGSNLKERSP